MLRTKVLPMTMLALAFCFSQGWAATFTECYQETCASITVPDQILPDTDFEVLVEGTTEGASAWSISAYQLYEGVDWQYDQNHMVDAAGGTLIDYRGFYWGGSLSKTLVLNRPAGTYDLTFVFGPRGWQHGYYDAAVDAQIVVGASVQAVPFDIKPRSCPNPLNIGKKGLVSAAIVGSADFDVHHVDPETIEVAGVKPIRYAFEDVTEPYLPETGKASELDCTTGGPDGYLDLVLKFQAEELFEALESAKGEALVDGETFIVLLEGQLSGQGAAAPIAGEDVVRILRKK